MLFDEKRLTRPADKSVLYLKNTLFGSYPFLSSFELYAKDMDEEAAMRGIIQRKGNEFFDSILLKFSSGALFAISGIVRSEKEDSSSALSFFNEISSRITSAYNFRPEETMELPEAEDDLISSLEKGKARVRNYWNGGVYQTTLDLSPLQGENIIVLTIGLSETFWMDYETVEKIDRKMLSDYVSDDIDYFSPLEKVEKVLGKANEDGFFTPSPASTLPSDFPSFLASYDNGVLSIAFGCDIGIEKDEDLYDIAIKYTERIRKFYGVEPLIIYNGTRKDGSIEKEDGLVLSHIWLGERTRASLVMVEKDKVASVLLKIEGHEEYPPAYFQD